MEYVIEWNDNRKTYSVRHSDDATIIELYQCIRRKHTNELTERDRIISVTDTKGNFYKVSMGRLIQSNKFEYAVMAWGPNDSNGRGE